MTTVSPRPSATGHASADTAGIDAVAIPEAISAYRWVFLAVLWITYVVVFLARLSVGPLAPFF